MKDCIRQRSPGLWELTIDQGRDPLGRRRRKTVTVRGTKSAAQCELRRLLNRGLSATTVPSSSTSSSLAPSIILQPLVRTKREREQLKPV